MKALVLVALVGLALVLPIASAGPFLPPVCLQKSATVAHTTVTAQLTCEVWVEVTHCPPVGSGPCWALVTESLP